MLLEYLFNIAYILLANYEIKDIFLSHQQFEKQLAF